tara:strand:- start:545 stop:862 length:318 start_codon:yes stop_codon:yes gene_type:complete
MANGIKLLRGTLVEHNNFNDFENGEITAITNDAGTCLGELRIHTGDNSAGKRINNTEIPIKDSSGNDVISESSGNVTITATNYVGIETKMVSGLSPTVASIALGG